MFLFLGLKLCWFFFVTSNASLRLTKYHLVELLNGPYDFEIIEFVTYVRNPTLCAALAR